MVQSRLRVSGNPAAAMKENERGLGGGFLSTLRDPKKERPQRGIATVRIHE